MADEVPTTRASAKASVRSVMTTLRASRPGGYRAGFRKLIIVLAAATWSRLRSSAGALDRDVVLVVRRAVDALDDRVDQVLGDAHVGVRVAKADRPDARLVAADRGSEELAEVVGGHAVLLAEADEQPS